MHLVVIFHNIGGYHAARLRATEAACRENDWRMTAIQITAATNEHPWGDLGREITFPLRSLSSPADGKSLGASAKSAATLLTESLDELRPDAVAIPGWGFPESRAALGWCRRRGARAILMSESKWDDEPRSWWKELIKSRLYVRRFDAALVGGELHREYLQRMGFPREKIFLGYDVVDNEFFARRADAARQDPYSARRRQPRLPQRPFFLAATRFIARKNVTRLIDSYHAYRERTAGDERLDLVICGSGVEEAAIRGRINHHRLADHVHLPGFVAYQDIGDWYGLASAFVHPAWQEQWGLVVNEACAAGLPILCSRTVGAAHEIVADVESGWLFDPQQTAEITRALVDLHRADESQRESMGRRSRRLVEQFGPRRFAGGMMNCLKDDEASEEREMIENLSTNR